MEKDNKSVEYKQKLNKINGILTFIMFIALVCQIIALLLNSNLVFLICLNIFIIFAGARVGVYLGDKVL